MTGALIGSAVLGVGSSIAGGKAQSKAAGKAADASVQTTEMQIAAQKEAAEKGTEYLTQGFNEAKEATLLGSREAMETLARSGTQQVDFQKALYDEQKALQLPWQEAGLQALEKYSAMPEFSFTAEDFTADPSYAFRQQEGIKALDRSAAARGRVLSGGQDRAITRYGSDLASQEFGAAYGRAANTYGMEANRLQNLMGVGQQATSQLSGALGQGGANVGNVMASTGTNLANIEQSRGGALSNLYASQGAGLANIQQGLSSAQSSAYGQQGSSLANIYQSQGQGQANMYGGIAQSANQGLSNYMLMNYLGK